MLTVSILVNGRPVYTRSVVNRLDELGGYACDDGTLIEHDPEDGAVALAIKALQTIHEVRPRSAAPSLPRPVLLAADVEGRPRWAPMRPVEEEA